MRTLEPRDVSTPENPIDSLIEHERRNSGPQCMNMSDVRYEIDRLDRVLVQLVAERQTYIEAAARIKPAREKVRDQDRIEDVVSKVLRAAESVGLSATIAEPVWRCLIEQSIAHEFETFDDLRESA